jgi:hypothetical protein
MKIQRPTLRSVRSLLGAAVLGIAAVVTAFGQDPAPVVFELDADWGTLDTSILSGVAVAATHALSWSNGAVGYVSTAGGSPPFILTTNIGGQVDAGSFNDEFSIQLKDSGVLYLMANATGLSDLSAGISVPGATAVGDVFEIGGARYTHVLKADGPTSASVYLVNLTDGSTTSTPLFTRTGVSPAALGTYLATGGNSLADVRFLFARPDRPEFIDVSFTGDVRQFGVPSDFVGVWDTVFYSDLAFDPRDNKLYVTLNAPSGYAFRGNFTPAAAAVTHVTFTTDPQFFSLDSAHTPGAALTDNYVLIWSSGGSVGFARKTFSVPILGGLTTNIGGQIDAGSYTDGTSIQLKDNGVLYLMDNTTGQSDLSAGISVPGATAVGNVFNIGETLFTHILRPEGTDGASAWLVNLTTGWVSPTPLFTQTGVTPQALATYMAVGGTSLRDVHFLFGESGSPNMLERTATAIVRYFDSELAEYFPARLLEDLVIDVPQNLLYVMVYNGSGSWMFRGDFAPAAALPSSPYDPQPQAEATGGNTLTFSFETRAGLPYTIQRSTDLVTWTDVETILGTGTRHIHEHPLTGQAVFFRVAYLP